jgi:HEAT repeat protein
VSLMVLHSFAMGTSTVFFETAASALFLARFASGALPWVYLAAAGVNTLTGLAYARLQARLSFRALMLGTVAFLLAGLVALRGGLALVDAGALVFGLLVFYRVLSALTDLEYWAVATRLYDVRQAKRLFGLVGSGEVVARIVGSFSVPFLVRPLGVPNLIVLSALGLVGSLVLLLALLPRAKVHAPGAPRSATTKAPAALSGLLRQPYLSMMLSMVAAGVLGKYFVDYAFLAELKGHADDAKRLASFFGVFSGATQAASLLTRLFVSGPLLSRFGIRLGLLVLPAIHLACTLGVVASGLLGVGPGVFWLVILNQGAYKTLKHPIDNPSLKVLYQPLLREDRLAAQIAVETLVTPVMVGVAGLVLLLFDALDRYDPVRFAWVMLPVFAVWLALARRAGSGYASALVAALKGRLPEPEALSLEDQRTLGAIREVLREGSPGDVVFALDLLDRARDDRAERLVLDLVDHPSPEVRRAAARRLERRRPPGALDALARLGALDLDSGVRAAALEALGSFSDPGSTERLLQGLDADDGTVRRGALVGLLRQEGERHPAAGHALAEAVASREPRRRAWAALAIGESGRGDLAGVLAPLLDDASTDVRRAAIAAAPKLGEPALWTAVAAALEEPALAGLAAGALADGGGTALGALSSLWGQTRRSEVHARIARALGRIGGPEATAILRNRLATPDENVRHSILAALGRCRYQAEERERPAILDLVRREAEDAAWSLAGCHDLEEQPGLGLTASALAGEAARNRDNILILLSFVGDPVPFLRARVHLAGTSKEKRAYALEVLEVATPSEVREVVLPLFEDSSSGGSRRVPHTPTTASLPPPERVRALLRRSEEWTTPWTRAVALYEGGRLGLDLRAEAERAAATGTAGLVEETARALLEGTGRQERKRMLTIERVITLKAVDMFSRASEEVLTEVAGILEEVDARAGEVVFEKGADGDSMYIIVSGRVRVHDGDRTIGELGPRDIFGDLALLDPEPRVASISALTDASLLRLDREAFAELMAGNIEIVRGVLHVLCERLRREVARPD